MPNVSALALAPHGRNAGAASAIMGSPCSRCYRRSRGLAVGYFNDGTVVHLSLFMLAGVVLGWLSYWWVGQEGS